MSQIKFLDCTLRDGGYINQWKFGRETVRDMLNRFSKAGVDIVECGFLTEQPGKEAAVPGLGVFYSGEKDGSSLCCLLYLIPFSRSIKLPFSMHLGAKMIPGAITLIPGIISIFIHCFILS